MTINTSYTIYNSHSFKNVYTRRIDKRDMSLIFVISNANVEQFIILYCSHINAIMNG